MRRIVYYEYNIEKYLQFLFIFKFFVILLLLQKIFFSPIGQL